MAPETPDHKVANSLKRAESAIKLEISNFNKIRQGLMSGRKVSMGVRGDNNLCHLGHPVEKGMLLIKQIVDAQGVLFMKIREIIRIKILNKIAIIQKICTKTTQMSTQTHKVTTLDKECPFVNPRRLEV